MNNHPKKKTGLFHLSYFKYNINNKLLFFSPPKEEWGTPIEIANSVLSSHSL